ncbi:MAG: AMP-binding protein [Deinococcales bacterium]
MSQNIESVLQETRRFSPSSAFKASAKLNNLEDYKRLYRQSLDEPEVFWGDVAKELTWFEPWTQVLDWQEPFVKWFVGGKTNISYNSLDHQIDQGKGNKVAIFWEGENGDTAIYTYNQLKDKVCQFANMLKAHGIAKGDRVAIYMPMIPEAVIAMQACARIGATHSIVFGGFSSTALSDRINDASAKAVITADGGYRRGSVFALKPACG